MFIDTSRLGRELVWKKSSGGHVYGVMEITRMPRIGDEFLNCVFYHYKTSDEARKGELRGGTGFLVRIKSKVQPTSSYVYAVTNAHVIKGSPVIRLNTLDGKTDILELSKDNWITDPSGNDLAVCLLILNTAVIRSSCVDVDEFLTKEIVAKHNIGPGDEVFMSGRFINHEGRQTNTPAVRFGNIAMMPLEPIYHNGHQEESFLVEVRSIGGYSGSPLFTYIPPFSLRPPYTECLADVHGPWLLGVNWAYIRNREPVREGKDKNFACVGGSYEGWNVDSNTGMAAVVPAWKLAELLNIPALKAQRDQEEDKLANLKAESGIVETSS